MRTPRSDAIYKKNICAIKSFRKGAYQMKVLRHQIDNEINSLLCLQGADNVVQIESIYKNSTDV